jgi:predicted NBD/HSP70 family sugar kinase
MIVGIDLGGTKIAYALVDSASGTVRRAMSRPPILKQGLPTSWRAW